MRLKYGAGVNRAPRGFDVICGVSPFEIYARNLTHQKDFVKQNLPEGLKIKHESESVFNLAEN